MTTVVLTTSDLIGSFGSVTETGGVAENTLDDGNDSTGLTLVNTTSTGFQASMSLGTFTLGTGRLKSWFVTVRRGLVTGVPVGMTTSIGSEAPNDFGLMPQIFDLVGGSVGLHGQVTVASAAQVPPAYTQAMIDAMSVTFYADPSTGGTALVTEMSVSVTYAVAPTANITYPTGSPALTTTSTLAATWTHTAGSDGSKQVAYELKVFTAAQYGAGGFSADTSTPFYTSGIVTSGAATASAPALTNSTTYRVYLRTAQLVNGVQHWSPWDFEAFSTNFTPSSVSTVTAVAGAGFNTVTVARNTGTAAWVSLEVERSNDNGTTWTPVRGATHVKATNTFVTTWAANSIVVVDYEAPNGQGVLYQARASTALVAGAWVQSSPAVTWTSTSTYLKDPFDPTKNITIRFADGGMPDFSYSRTAGQAVVVARSDTVITVDVLRLGEGSMIIHTATAAAATALRVMLASNVWLIHAPTTHMVGDPESTGAGGTTFYCVPLNGHPMRAVSKSKVLHRYWQVDFVQVTQPADDTDYS